MLAPFATLAFLAVLWMLAVVGSVAFAGSRAKIVAALRGKSRAVAFETRPARVRHQRYPSVRAYRSTGPRRAAA